MLNKKTNKLPFCSFPNILQLKLWRTTRDRRIDELFDLLKNVKPIRQTIELLCAFILSLIIIRTACS